MRLGIFLILAVTSALFFQACDKKPPLQDTPEQDDIKKNIEAYKQAFDNHDAVKLSSLWSPDGYHINFTTQESAEGIEQITDHFQALFDEKNAEDITISISSIHFPDANEAIVKGLAEITYQDQDAEKSAFLIQYVKANGKWTIQSYSVHEIDPPLSHFEQLKELNWLAGKWEDEDDNVDVEYTVEWELNKNFLMQQFTLSILGQDALTGKQIIGWDPVEKKIRSWTFDSDGGYGSSVWSKEGNSWYAFLSFTLSQGGVASATYVYTYIDDSTYTFAIINRDIDGNLLPNIGPFKVIRKK